MSQIVFYFLHSTSVNSFYIDVVLTLSISMWSIGRHAIILRYILRNIDLRVPTIGPQGKIVSEIVLMHPEMSLKIGPFLK